MTEVKHHLSSAERLTLIQTLNALPGPQFDELVFALNPPPGNISSNSAPQGSRSAALLHWVESPIGPGLADLKAVLTSFVGSTTTATPQPAPQQQTVEALIDIIKALSQNQAPKYDLRGAQFAGGFAETVQRDQIGGGVNSGAQPPPSQRSQQAHPETEAQQIRAKLLRRLRSDSVDILENSLREWVKIALRMEDQRQRVGKHKLELVPEDTDDTRAEASRSFTNRVFQPLGTQETPATTLEATQSLLPILKRSDVQDRLLILGEPGAGKTTELVALAYDLLVQTEQDEYSPIPIIFELSTWQENIPIEQWIVAQIKKRYKISESISQQWIHDEQLIPLLDGLDELGLVKQKQCVVAINQFLEEKIYPYAVVCCRREEYEKAQAELSQLRWAIYLQPLTDEQIQGYLRDLNRFRLWNSISASPELLDLSRRPLFLAMVVVAYQGQPIRNESDLFNTYIQKQLQDLNHQGAYPPGKAPSQQKTLHYLSWLARQLEGLEEKDFLIEEMQPSWLSSAYRHLYRLMAWLIVGLMVGLMCDLALWPILLVNFHVIGLILGPITGIIMVSISVLMSELMGGSQLMGGIEEIEPIEKIILLNWGELIFRLISGLILGSMILILGLMIGLPSGNLMIWLTWGLIAWLADVVFKGLTWGRLEGKYSPNQGIQKSLQSALVITLITLITLSLGVIVMANPQRSLGFRLTFGVTSQ